jgi:uncharacterized membrane protein YgcG
MSTKRTVLALLLGLLLALMVGGLALAQERSYQYDQIEVDLVVQPNGTLVVTETLTLAFTGGPFQRASRGIAFDRLDSIENVSVSEGATSYTLSSTADTPGTFLLNDQGQELLVRWVYEPTSNQSRTFTINYTVQGAIRVTNEADELWWVAIFPTRDVPVQQSRVTISLPAGATLEPQNVALPIATGSVTVTSNQVLVVRNELLEPGEALEVQVSFPPTIVQSSKPVWQQRLEAPAPTPRPRVSTPAAAEEGSSWSCWPFLALAALILFSMLMRAINPDSGNDEGDEGDDSYRRRRRWGSSNSSSSSSRSSSSSSRSSSSSSRSRSSSSRGGSGGGSGGAS